MTDDFVFILCLCIEMNYACMNVLRKCIDEKPWPPKCQVMVFWSSEKGYLLVKYLAAKVKMFAGYIRDALNLGKG